MLMRSRRATTNSRKTKVRLADDTRIVTLRRYTRSIRDWDTKSSLHNEMPAFRMPARGRQSGGNRSAAYGLNVGSLLSESTESVAYKQDPGRGKEGVHNNRHSETRDRNDPKDTGSQAQIGRDFVENSPQHYETDHEDSERKSHYCIHDL